MQVANHLPLLTVPLKGSSICVPMFLIRTNNLIENSPLFDSLPNLETLSDLLASVSQIMW